MGDKTARLFLIDALHFVQDINRRETKRGQQQEEPTEAGKQHPSRSDQDGKAKTGMQRKPFGLIIANLSVASVEQASA